MNCADEQMELLQTAILFSYIKSIIPTMKQGGYASVLSALFAATVSLVALLLPQRLTMLETMRWDDRNSES